VLEGRDFSPVLLCNGKAFKPDIGATAAWIVINGRADHECSVLDAAPGGAKVVVQDDAGIPERFELAFFLAVDRRRNCEVIWRRGKVLGVKFVT
jgi:hypothetical protein